MFLSILAILLLTILFVIAVLLFSPIILRIDTDGDVYEVQMPHLISFRLLAEKEELYFRLNGPFFRKNFFPFRPDSGSRGAEKKASSKPGKVRRKKSPGLTPGLFIKMLGTFRIREFSCSVDTGDYARNACLIPVMQLIPNHRDSVNINFNGEFSLRFTASNTLWRLGRQYLKTKT